MRLARILRSGTASDRHPMASWEFDTDIVSQTDRKLVLCAPPRTASTYLTELLRAAGFGVPEEYFGWHIERDIRARTDLSKRMSKHKTDKHYLERIIGLRTFGGLFSVKLQYWHLQRLARSGLAEQLFDGAETVFLTRENIVDQAISQAVAMLTWRWLNNASDGVQGVQFSNAQLRKAYLDALHFVLWERDGFEKFFATTGICPLRLKSEALTEEPLAQLAKIATLVGCQIDNISEVTVLIEARDRHTVDADLKDRLRREIVPSMPGFEILAKCSRTANPMRAARQAIENIAFRLRG